MWPTLCARDSEQLALKPTAALAGRPLCRDSKHRFRERKVKREKRERERERERERAEREQR